MKVMVVQDRVLADLGLEDEIRMAGHVVIGSIAHSAEAIHQASVHRPEVALIDLDRLSKEEACDLAEALKDRFSVSIIAMTAHFERAKACLHALFGVLMKPFAFEQVPTALRTTERIVRGEVSAPESILVFESEADRNNSNRF
jgi:two-component SAPR family response regulator